MEDRVAKYRESKLVFCLLPKGRDEREESPARMGSGSYQEIPSPSYPGAAPVSAQSGSHASSATAPAATAAAAAGCSRSTTTATS